MLPIISCIPNFDSGVDTTFRCKTIITESVSGKEERQATQQRPLILQSFTTLSLKNTESKFLKQIISTRGEHAVAMPVWMDVTWIDEDVAANDEIIKCKASCKLFNWFRYAIVWSSSSDYEIVQILSIANDQLIISNLMPLTRAHKKGSYILPLAVGTIELPHSTYINANASEIEIDFEERPGFDTFGDWNPVSMEFVFDLVTSSSVDYTTFPVDVDWGVEPEHGDTDDLNYEPLSVGSTTPWATYKSRQTVSYSYSVNRDQLQNLLNHFAHHDGSRGSFSIQTPNKQSESLLVRYQDDEIEIHSISGNKFELDCNFIEVSSDDTTSKVAYLYKIKKENDIYYAANWQNTIQAKETVDDTESKNWIAADVIHKELDFSDEMLGEEIEITINGKLREWLLSRDHNKTTTVSIYKLDILNYSSDSVPTKLFEGNVVETKTGMSGKTDLSLSSNLRILERDMPRLKLQRQCNWILYSTQCGINKSDYVFPATVTAISNNGYTASVTFNTTKNEKFFTGATVTDENGKVHIVNSDAGSTDVRMFTLDSPVSCGTVTVVAWCDKSILCCKNKFANSINFGGCPYLPNNNIIDETSINDSTGGKK